MGEGEETEVWKEWWWGSIRWSLLSIINPLSTFTFDKTRTHTPAEQSERLRAEADAQETKDFVVAEQKWSKERKCDVNGGEKEPDEEE